MPGTPIIPTTAERVRAAIAAVVAGETDSYRIEARRRRGDGSYFWVLNFGRVAERDAQGRPLRMVGTTIDIDQRKEAELEPGRPRAAAAPGAGGRRSRGLGVRSWRRTHPLRRHVSVPAGLGPQPEWSPLDDVLDLIHPRDRGRVRAMFAQCRRGNRSQARVEFRMRRRDGGYAWIEEHAQVSERGPDGRPLQMVGVSADITARKEAEMRLAHLALHDPLTGPAQPAGPGRGARAHASPGRERSGLPLAVLALDLDGFKAINDRLGHPAGDATLLEVADRLRRTIRRSDLVARLGGDEFAVIASDLNGPAPVSPAGAADLGTALRTPIVLRDAVAEIDVSIGVAFYPGDGETTEELLGPRRCRPLCRQARAGRAACSPADLPVAAA